MIDLLVAGAGPAGAATAIRAAMAGLDVVVVEPREAPIDKACGEGIAHSAVEYLARLGVELTGRPFYGIRYLDGSRCVDARFRAGPGLGVRRTELQRGLHDRLAALGVPVLRERVGTVRQSAEAVTAAGITARYLAAADGLHSPVRRQLGLGATGRPGEVRRGLRQHYAIKPWTDLVEVYWSSLGEAYVTPVSSSTVGVAVLTAERGSLAAHLQAFPRLQARLEEASAVSGVLGAGPLRQRVRRRVAGRVLLVGDSAGYVDALTGEGIAVALRTSAELVRCVAADRPEDYEAAWRRVSRECRLLTASLLWARNRSLLAPRIVPAAAALPGVYGAIVNRLA
ncbi:monooxygenase FAD-binding protein [Kribbella flavida DSM 17836]|uniref:Monooxygenase FAD-binding protein n=1 Tax=Kribbella flavida (strain DSM 17836 / JCM 10339 / NBRC 14399) TaxID=479435 RepID=D2PWG8_KRIFD|nr:FAD-dependent monooxygenase [Kribbella flavida]ADB31620.1 monooxygenase FAD-binding protein [Kribbella flavida DSM 17836]